VSGRWAASGKRLQAGAGSTVAVTPKAWRCHVHALHGSCSLNFPQERALPPKNRSGSSGPSGYSKRAGGLQKEAIEAQWRQGAQAETQTYRARKKKEKEALMKKPASGVVSKAAKPLKLKKRPWDEMPRKTHPQAPRATASRLHVRRQSGRLGTARGVRDAQAPRPLPARTYYLLPPTLLPTT
jgi:hypothetical protein